MGFTISFAGAKDFTPYEGGGDLFPFEGHTFGKILKIEEGVSKESKNSMLIFTIGCDETEGRGLKAKKWVPVTGMRSDGKPNVLGLLEAVSSVYSDGMADADAVAKARGLDGQSLDSSVIITQLTGKMVYFEVRARQFQREDGTSGWGTEIANFALKGKYNDLKAIDQHHRKLPQQATQGGSAPAPSGGLNLGGGQPNGAAPQGQAGGAKAGALGIL